MKYPPARAGKQGGGAFTVIWDPATMQGMPQAVIQSYYCSDVDDLDTWVPASDLDIYIPIDLYIGPEGEEGTNIFSILVASPPALNRNGHRGKSKVFVVHTWDWNSVKSTFVSWVEEVGEGSWERLTDKLRKKFHWEFEGMGGPES